MTLVAPTSRLLGLLSIAGVLAAGCDAEPGIEGEEPSSPASRPNVILILADDLGYETLGSYGGVSYETPELDRLAESGVRFTHAYASPLCSPHAYRS